MKENFTSIPSRSGPPAFLGCRKQTDEDVPAHSVIFEEIADLECATDAEPGALKRTAQSVGLGSGRESDTLTFLL
jgi:hypothetical protein